MNSVKFKVGSDEYYFETWNQRPQPARPIIEASTRLGGKTLIRQTIKYESERTNCTATMTSDAATSKAAIEALDKVWSEIIRIFGKKGTWTDENGITLENVYIMDGTRNIQAKDGASKALMAMNLTVSMDGYSDE